VVTLAAIAFAGFFAQLVDGSLGMGYGVTSTSLLLTLGLAPALASASVHSPRSAPPPFPACRIGAWATSTCGPC
jgi:hypothetical protein